MALWLDWISLLVRWFHVIAGIAWIGASFYFIWLDSHLQKPPLAKHKAGIKGDLWAIHSGGFYEISKYAYGPKTIPQPLHWFKWEAYSTWLSGFALLVFIYYLSAPVYLIDTEVMELSPAQAVGLGLALIFGAFILYELACRSPAARYPKRFASGLVILLAVTTWLATHMFSGRGAYIHVGALIGTIMVANVLLTIIPNQKKMVAAGAAGATIDARWGEQAKLRSVHNNYLTLPIVFIMISNHYPQTYQHTYNGAILIALMLTAAWARHYFNLRHTGIHKPWVLISAGAAMVIIAAMVSWPQVSTAPQQSTADNAIPSETASEKVSDQRFHKIMQTHCISCHSRTPSHEVFQMAPMGVVLDRPEDFERFAAQIYRRTVVTQDMPFLNKTNMSAAERQQVARWFEQR